MPANSEVRVQRSEFRVFKIFLLFFIIVTSYLLLVTFSSPAFAQAPPSLGVSSGETKLDGSNFNYLVNGGVNLGYTIPCGLMMTVGGFCPVSQSPGIKLGSDGTSSLYLYDRLPGGGAIGGVTSVMMAMYSAPPIAAGEYLAMVKRDFGIVKPAYAQVGGSGSGIIGPVAKLWEVVRNLSYLMFIVVFLAVVLMIMFRQKLNPQTVLTVQNALPGLVIGLVLVTFSYFIAALLVDMSFVGVQLVAQIFAGAVNEKGEVINAFGKNAGDLTRLAQESNLMQLFSTSALRWDNFADVGQVTKDATNSILPPGLGLGAAVLGGIVSVVLLAVGMIPFGIGLGIGALALGSSSLTNFNVVGLIVPLILIIALFVQFIRLAFQLLKAYISLLVFTVVGPLIIMFSAVPGRGGALGLWWKSILANSLVFPAVFGGFLFAGMILGTDPAIWSATPPLFGGLNIGFIRILIAYGILLGIPAIPDMVKNAMGVKDIQGIPQAAVQGAQAGAGVIGAGVQGTIKPLQNRANAYRESYYRWRYADPATRGPQPTEPNRLVKWLSRV